MQGKIRENQRGRSAVALLGGAALLIGLAAGIGPGASHAEAQMVNVRGRPMYGQTRLRTGFMPDPQILRGMAGGPIPGQNINPQCRGYYAPNPSHIVFADTGFAQLRYVVSAPQDTTLMVMLPNGQILCDDDGGESNNPLVVSGSPRGRIAIWVGTYSSSSAGQVGYSLGLSELPNVSASTLAGGGVVVRPNQQVVVAGQGLQANGRPSFGQLALQRGFAPDPQILQGMAGGPISASQVNSSCRGYISSNPNHVLFTQSGFANLRLVGSSNTDTTLVVMLPNGQLVCDDDGGEGSNPLATLSSPPGRIAIWVGTYSSARAGQAPYQLGLTEYPHIQASNLNNPVVQNPGVVVTGPQVRPVGPQLPPGMQPDAAPTFGVLPLDRGFPQDPRVMSGTHGGPITASRLRGTGACRGYLSGAPNHTIVSRTGFPHLRVLVNAPQDTTLVVMDAAGQIFCDDDGGAGNNPQVLMNGVPPGALRVWVGSYSRGAVGGPYSIGFSEIPSVTTAHIPAPGQGNQVAVVTPGGNPGVGVIAAAQGLVGEAVQMTFRIPVTIMGPGMTSPTVAAWRPRGGPEVRVGIPPSPSGMIPLLAQYNNQTTTLERVPAAMVQGGVLTATQQRNGDLVLRTEVAPSPGDQGRIMILRLTWNGTEPVIADRWQGDFRRRPPRWAR